MLYAAKLSADLGKDLAADLAAEPLSPRPLSGVQSPSALPPPQDALQHDSEEEEEEWDLRPHRNRRAHLAEYFDDDDAEGDLLDTDKPSREYEEPPSDDDDGL